MKMSIRGAKYFNFINPTCCRAASRRTRVGKVLSDYCCQGGHEVLLVFIIVIRWNSLSFGRREKNKLTADGGDTGEGEADGEDQENCDLSWKGHGGKLRSGIIWSADSSASPKSGLSAGRCDNNELSDQVTRLENAISVKWPKNLMRKIPLNDPRLSCRGIFAAQPGNAILQCFDQNLTHFERKGQESERSSKIL